MSQAQPCAPAGDAGFHQGNRRRAKPFFLPSKKGLLQNYGFATDPLVGSIPPSRLAPCHLPLHKGGFWPGACSDVVLSGEILPISSLKSDNRNTAVPRPPCVKGAVTVGDWGIVSGGELGNLRILQQALSAVRLTKGDKNNPDLTATPCHLPLHKGGVASGGETPCHP